VSIRDGGAVADPFQPSGALVDLLHTRRAQLASPARPTPLGRVGAALRFA
jgi:hypothetical protein